jgi:hypothetical protein
LRVRRPHACGCSRLTRRRGTPQPFKRLRKAAPEAGEGGDHAQDASVAPPTQASSPPEAVMEEAETVVLDDTLPEAAAAVPQPKPKAAAKKAAPKAAPKPKPSTSGACGWVGSSVARSPRTVERERGDTRAPVCPLPLCELAG